MEHNLTRQGERPGVMESGPDRGSAVQQMASSEMDLVADEGVGYQNATRWARSAGFAMPCMMSNVLLSTCGDTGASKDEDLASLAMGILCKAKIVTQKMGLPASFVFKKPGWDELRIRARQEQDSTSRTAILVVEIDG